MQERWEVVDGGVVRHREAETDRERGQLRHEATMLALARHPGVVEVVAADQGGEHLVTRASAAATLDGSWPPPPAALDPAADRRAHHELGHRPGSPAWLAALASASQTVADLHALGLVHDDLAPGVIWVDGRGQAILDGFGRAGLAGQQLENRPCLRPSGDVAALAQAARSAPDVVRGRRGRRAGPGPRLAAVLDAGRIGTWPPARHLAQALQGEAERLGGTGRSSRPAPPTPPSEPPTTRVGRTARPAGTGAGSPSDLGVADRVADRGGDRDGDRDVDVDPFARLRPVEVSPTRGRRPVPVVAAAVIAVVGAAALAGGVIALVGQASRPSLGAAARPVATPQVVVDGTTYRIGRPGDQVQVGRWSCGPARAVVLRPSTGQVFAFSGWARAEHDLVARPVGRVAVGSRLVATPAGTGCDQLGARAPDGTTTRLDPEVTR